MAFSHYVLTLIICNCNTSRNLSQIMFASKPLIAMVLILTFAVARLSVYMLTVTVASATISVNMLKKCCKYNYWF